MIKRTYCAPTIVVAQMDIENIMEVPFSGTTLSKDGKTTNDGAPTLGEDKGTEGSIGDDQSMGAKRFSWDDTTDPEW